MHPCLKKDIIFLASSIKDMVSNFDSDLDLVYLVTASEGNMMDLMIMLQIFEKRLHCIPFLCRYKI